MTIVIVNGHYYDGEYYRLTEAEYYAKQISSFERAVIHVSEYAGMFYLSNDKLKTDTAIEHSVFECGEKIKSAMKEYQHGGNNSKLLPLNVYPDFHCAQIGAGISGSCLSQWYCKEQCAACALAVAERQAKTELLINEAKKK